MAGFEFKKFFASLAVAAGLMGVSTTSFAAPAKPAPAPKSSSVECKATLKQLDQSLAALKMDIEYLIAKSKKPPKGFDKEREFSKLHEQHAMTFVRSQQDIEKKCGEPLQRVNPDFERKMQSLKEDIYRAR